MVNPELLEYQQEAIHNLGRRLIHKAGMDNSPSFEPWGETAAYYAPTTEPAELDSFVYDTMQVGPVAIRAKAYVEFGVAGQPSLREHCAQHLRQLTSTLSHHLAQHSAEHPVDDIDTGTATDTIIRGFLRLGEAHDALQAARELTTDVRYGNDPAEVRIRNIRTIADYIDPTDPYAPEIMTELLGEAVRYRTAFDARTEGTILSEAHRASLLCAHNEVFEYLAPKLYPLAPQEITTLYITSGRAMALLSGICEIGQTPAPRVITAAMKEVRADIQRPRREQIDHIARVALTGEPHIAKLLHRAFTISGRGWQLKEAMARQKVLYEAEHERFEDALELLSHIRGGVDVTFPLIARIRQIAKDTGNIRLAALLETHNAKTELVTQAIGDGSSMVPANIHQLDAHHQRYTWRRALQFFIDHILATHTSFPPQEAQQLVEACETAHRSWTPYPKRLRDTEQHYRDDFEPYASTFSHLVFARAYDAADIILAAMYDHCNVEKADPKRARVIAAAIGDAVCRLAAVRGQWEAALRGPFSSASQGHSNDTANLLVAFGTHRQLWPRR